MISFVTAIKIGPMYEDYMDRLRMYFENISICPCIYEIIVVEEQTPETSIYLKDVFTPEELKRYSVNHIPYKPDYPNPYGYPIIEAFAKNIGIKHAQYTYICVTNADILFENFDFISFLRPRHFYRFIEYEIPIPPTWTYSSQLFIKEKCLNPKLNQLSTCTVQDVAYKSGDCMLLDRNTWNLIGGFPENTVWTHSDYIVCKVVNNNRIPLQIPHTPIYTYYQPDKVNKITQPELNIVRSYEYAIKCNP